MVSDTLARPLESMVDGLLFRSLGRYTNKTIAVTALPNRVNRKPSRDHGRPGPSLRI